MNQWLGAVFVIGATTYTGIWYGEQLQEHIRQLTKIRKILLDLYCDVEYGGCTLSESLERIAKKQDILLREWLGDLCEKMRLDKGLPFEEIFERSVYDKLTNSALSAQDIKRMAEFGKSLGSTQRVNQLRAIQIYQKELEQRIEELESDCREKRKISRILGISSGVLIVILLL